VRRSGSGGGLRTSRPNGRSDSGQCASIANKAIGAFDAAADLDTHFYRDTRSANGDTHRDSNANTFSYTQCGGYMQQFLGDY